MKKDKKNINNQISSFSLSKNYNIHNTFMNFSKKWLIFSAGMLIFIHISCEIIPIFIAFKNNFLYNETSIKLIIESLFFIILYLFGIFQVENKIGSLALGFGFYFSGDWIFQMFERNTSYTLGLTIWGIITIIGLFALLFTIIRLLIQLIEVITKFNPNVIEYFKDSVNIKAQSKIQWLFLILLIFSGIIFGITSSKYYGNPILIEPQDYQIEFRIWGRYYPEYYINHPYGTAILEQLNRHSVTIQNTLFSIRDADNETYSYSPTISAYDEQKVVETLTWFKDNYPNINFQYYAFGLGYDSCGNYEGSIYTTAMLRRFVDICRKHDLPNVVGVYTDWEGPLRSAEKYANETRNGWHQAMWTEAMSYAKSYFPNWTFSCCHPDSTHWDRYDNDPDLQYYQRYNIFMPQWDDYGPMVYRSCDTKTPDPDDYSSSWKIYCQAKALLDGALNSNIDKATMWLGCTGCGPYRNNTISYEHGVPINFGNKMGFDAFARDILILKHYGFKTVSIFHGMETFEGKGILTGFFDQYGYTDALDRLNNTVNRPQSTDSFYIWSDGKWSPFDVIRLDAMLNLDSLYYLPVSFSIFLSGRIGLFIYESHKKKRH